MNTDIMKFAPTSTMINSYQMALKEVEDAFNHLAAAKQHLKDIYGDNGGHWRSEVLKSHQYYGDLEKAAQDSKREMKKTMLEMTTEI